MSLSSYPISSAAISSRRRSYFSPALFRRRPRRVWYRYYPIRQRSFLPALPARPVIIPMTKVRPTTRTAVFRRTQPVPLTTVRQIPIRSVTRVQNSAPSRRVQRVIPITMPTVTVRDPLPLRQTRVVPARPQSRTRIAAVIAPTQFVPIARPPQRICYLKSSNRVRSVWIPGTQFVTIPRPARQRAAAGMMRVSHVVPLISTVIQAVPVIVQRTRCRVDRPSYRWRTSYIPGSQFTVIPSRDRLLSPRMAYCRRTVTVPVAVIQQNDQPIVIRSTRVVRSVASGRSQTTVVPLIVNVMVASVIPTIRRHAYAVKYPLRSNRPSVIMPPVVNQQSVIVTMRKTVR